MPVLVALSLIGGQLPSFSVAATGYVLTIAAVLTGLALSGRVSDRRVSDRRVSDRRVSDRRVSDRRVSDRRVSDRRASARRVSDRRGSAPCASARPVVDQRWPRRRAPRRLGPAAGWWLVPLALLAVVEGWALALGPRAGYPTLSLLADPLLAHPVARSVAYGGWLWAFWALVRR
ncbi:MAG TPA: hypothetical protein VF755_03075 [Catenuloplanes sp.]